MSVAVLTSQYDAYDPLVAPRPQNQEIDWVCVTDGKTGPPPAPWREVMEPRPHLAPRMAAKVARCRPDLYTDAEVTVWIDASARIHRGDSIQLLVEALGPGQIAQFTHPERTSIRDEAAVSAGMRKYAGQSVRPQAEHYIAEGFPDGWGLWATGCIVRRAGGFVQQFGDAWLTEMLRWSWQDQVSEPYLLWRFGVRPVDLPGDLWRNPLVGFDYSQRKRDD